MELGQQGLRVGSFTPRKKEMKIMKIGRKGVLGDKSHSGVDAVMFSELGKEGKGERQEESFAVAFGT